MSKKADEIFNSYGSEADVTPKPESNEPSTLESVGQGAMDFTRGAAQGATLGFADELTAGGLAAKDYLKELITSGHADDFLKKYRSRKDTEDQLLKESEERSPYLSGAGNLVGGLASGIALSPLSLSGNIAKVGLKTALAEGGKLGVGKEIAKRLVAGGIDGVVAGGLTGAGQSEGSLDGDVTKLGKDALTGAIAGGTLGAVANGLIPAAPTAVEQVAEKQAISESGPLARQIRKSFTEGKEGRTISGQDAYKRIANEEMNTTRDVTEKLFQGRERLGQGISDSLDEAGAQGQKIGLQQAEEFPQYEPGMKGAKVTRGEKLQQVPGGGNELVPDMQIEPVKLKPNVAAGETETLNKVTNLAELIGQNRLPVTGQEAKGMISDLMSFLQGNLDPKRAYELSKQLKTMKGRLGGNFEMGNTVSDIIDVVDQKLGNLGGGTFDDAKGAFKKYSEATTDRLLTGNAPKGFSNVNGEEVSNLVNTGATKDAKGKVSEKIRSLILKSQKPGVSKKEQFDLLNTFKDELGQLEKDAPEVLEKAGLKDWREMFNQIQDTADLSAISQYTRKIDPSVENVKHVWDLANPTANLYKGANFAGRAARQVEKHLFNAPKEVLSNLSANLKEGGFGQYADSLNNALQTSDKNKTNAILFSLMQNPGIRKDIPKWIGLGEDQIEE